MIGISTQLFDVEGSLIIPNSKIRNIVNIEKSRRASSVKTLDGSSYALDFGYSETDNDINLEFINLTENEQYIINRIIEIHSKVYICSTKGAFLCIFKKLRVINESSKLNLIVVGTA